MLNPLKNVLTVEMVRSLIAKIKGALETKVSVDDVVSSWQSTPDDAHVPTEKLVKDTLDNLPPGTAVKGDAESEYRTGDVNLTPANIGAATASQGAKADSAVQGVKVNGTELSKDGDNVVDVPVPTASTSNPLKDGTASTGSSLQWARGDHRHPTDDSREAVANKKQSIDPTSTTEYGSSKALADFVNSSVATNTANFLGTISESSLGLDYTATNAQIELALNVHSWESAPTNNDYCFVSVNDPQTTDVDEYRRFKFNDKTNLWGYEYTLNNSSFTQAQWDAINSGLTSSDRAAYNAAVMLLNTHVGDGDIHVTAAQKTAWTAKQDALPKNGTSYAIDISGYAARAGSAGTASRATTASNYASGGDIDTALQGKSSTSHTHSVKINGATKTIAATGDTAVDLGTYLTSHQSVTDNNPTLAWGATSKVGTVGSTDLRVTMPANPASGKLDTNGDGSNVTAAFTAANTRANISTGDKLSVIFGKIAKWFADLKSVAWSGSYNDLSEKPNIPAAANNGILTITQNGTSKGTFGANQSSNNTIALTDTTYESKSEASDGTDVSLCTTGEKYTWNRKQNALPTTGTASTTYAIGISGNASTASTADKVKNGSNWTKTDNAAPQGLRVDRAYNNGWPYTYGNVVTVGGTGDGQLMLGWSGTTGGVAPIYYRNRRDQGGTTWSPWRTIAYQEDNGVSLSGQTLSVKINGTTQSLTNTDNTVKATAKTDNVNYKILATASASPTSGGLTEAVYDTDITLNPSTNTIAANISGRAALATTASQVSATGSQKALAVSVDGISHTNGSKSTVIDGGQVSTDTLSAETAVNSDVFWAKTFVLVYGGDTPGSPAGNYVLISPNGMRCYGAASFTGNLIGSASTASGVKDYNDANKTIEIGYAGQPLTSANYLAAYAVVDGHYYIKDISPSNVTVGRATADGSGNNIVNTYQKRIGFSLASTTYSVTVGTGQVKSIGNRSSSQAGFAYGSYGPTTLVDVEFDVSFTSPAGGYAIGFFLSSSESTSNAIDSQTVSRYYTAAPTYEHVRLCKVPTSDVSRLYILILNGTGSSISFTVSNIKLKIIKDFTSAATSI